MAQIVPVAQSGVTLGALAHIGVDIDMDTFNTTDEDILNAFEAATLAHE